MERKAGKARDPLVTSKMMAAVRNKNSRAELALRHALHAYGFRYRLHVRSLPGLPDLVLSRYRGVVFVDGDLWHGNAWRVRGLARIEDLFPHRTEWWVSKINRNIERDREVDLALTSAGWRVIRVWESDVLKNVDLVAGLVAEKLRTDQKVGDSKRHQIHQSPLSGNVSHSVKMGHCC